MAALGHDPPLTHLALRALLLSDAQSRCSGLLLYKARAENVGRLNLCQVAINGGSIRILVIDA